MVRLAATGSTREIGRQPAQAIILAIRPALFDG